MIFWYRKSKFLSESRTDNIVVGLNNIYALLIAITVLLTVQGLFAINVRELFASLSIIAAAIAIIAKDYISNLIGGMLITFSNNIAVGDHIKVGNNKGRVLDISISMFTLLTDDDFLAAYHDSIKEDSYHLKTVSIKKDAVEFKFQYVLDILDRTKEQEIRKNVICHVVQIIKQVRK